MKIFVWLKIFQVRGGWRGGGGQRGAGGRADGERDGAELEDQSGYSIIANNLYL